MSAATWTCTLERSPDGGLTAVSIDSGDTGGRTICVAGDRMTAIADPLRAVLARAGIRGRRWSSRRPLELDARTGHQAELLLLAVKPLRRPDRIARVAEGVARMGHEEASYWHAKASRRGGLRALRIILDGGST